MSVYIGAVSIIVVVVFLYLYIVFLYPLCNLQNYFCNITIHGSWIVNRALFSATRLSSDGNKRCRSVPSSDHAYLLVGVVCIRIGMTLQRLACWLPLKLYSPTCCIIDLDPIVHVKFYIYISNKFCSFMTLSRMCPQQIWFIKKYK